jgi:hypothetical protein
VDKYWAVVFVAHAIYGAFEWTRYRNFLKKGEVCAHLPAHVRLLLWRLTDQT